ncbi:helix-hairpin-helix domain-containing protein [Haloplanus sp. GCM10025708]|uniref:helix-hairpin-helix domain-containing protein n=1 Tax=Haloplanus sp. GCM10025708 TaxID=3252679 RepID=UPI0036D36309
MPIGRPHGISSRSRKTSKTYTLGELDEIEGVGESIGEKIAEYLETGELEYYEDLNADLPVDIEAITSVEGVGPKTAKKLYLELGIKTLDDLESAAEKERSPTLRDSVRGHSRTSSTTSNERKKAKSGCFSAGPSRSHRTSKPDFTTTMRSTRWTSSVRSDGVDRPSATLISWRPHPIRRQRWSASARTAT